VVELLLDSSSNDEVVDGDLFCLAISADPVGDLEVPVDLPPGIADDHPLEHGEVNGNVADALAEEAKSTSVLEVSEGALPFVPSSTAVDQHYLGSCLLLGEKGVENLQPLEALGDHQNSLTLGQEVLDHRQSYGGLLGFRGHSSILVSLSFQLQPLLLYSPVLLSTLLSNPLRISGVMLLLARLWLSLPPTRPQELLRPW
jgi:hypothetical protein